MDSYDNLKSFYGSERGGVSLDELSLTHSWFSNIICHWLILIHLNFHLYLHNISCWPVFFQLFTLFRCSLYFVSVSTDFTLRKVLRKRSRIRISLLKAE
jgi:hypothetical protein